MYSINDVAKILSVHRAMVESMIVDGRMSKPTVKLGPSNNHPVRWHH